MKPSIDHQKIAEAIDRLLSAWAMMMVEQCNEGLSAFDGDQPVIISKVAYSGSTSGSFTVLVQEPFMRDLATNLLDTDADESMLVDIAKELCNLLSGNLLTELYGCERAFSLDAPRVAVTDFDSIARSSWPHLSVLKADECPIALSFEAGE